MREFTMAGLIFLVYAIGLFSVPFADSINGHTFENLVGNSKENLIVMKKYCEKSGKECVLLYEYVPVNTESEK